MRKLNKVNDNINSIEMYKKYKCASKCVTYHVCSCVWTAFNDTGMYRTSGWNETDEYSKNKTKESWAK